MPIIKTKSGGYKYGQSGKGYGGFLLCYNGLHMARVPEWSKGAVRKTVVRKFESCPVLQSVTYNRGVKIKKKISLYMCFPQRPHPRLGLFGGYHRGLGYNEII